MSIFDGPFVLKQNDTFRSIKAVLTDDAGNELDLTQASAVQFHMAHRDKTVKVNAAAVITGVSPGEVQYNWQAADVDTPGDFDVEWRVSWNSGQVGRVPNDGHDWVKITRSLA